MASIALLGVLGAGAMSLLKGPVQTMSTVTKRTIAENNLILAGRLALIASAQQVGDCDHDNATEPLEWVSLAGFPAPANGGLLPGNVGATQQDPWGNIFGYCAWDHGSDIHGAGCGASPRRLSGEHGHGQIVISIISAGPDRVFQTICNHHGNGAYVERAPGSDDLVLSYTYAEAEVLSGGLWKLRTGDVRTAEIKKNLSVIDEEGAQKLTFDTDTVNLTLAEGGAGSFPTVKTDYLQNYAGNAIQVLNAVQLNYGAAIYSEAVNAPALNAIATASGSVGLRAKGMSKAIESDGLLDMKGNLISNVSAPVTDTDAATKKYVDDKIGMGKRVKCEAFVFSGCSGGTTASLTKSSLGDCKKACEDAGVTCCSAQYGTTASNPNAALSQCTGHSGGKPSGALLNLLGALLFPAYVGAYCYEQ